MSHSEQNPTKSFIYLTTFINLLPCACAIYLQYHNGTVFVNAWHFFLVSNYFICFQLCDALLNYAGDTLIPSYSSPPCEFESWLGMTMWRVSDSAGKHLFMHCV